jgi:hypothetical protein|uniref:Uncharacterized protein n=1 Tax=Myoviridae sp. ctdNl2 TaxID=2825140 RepID=A0A8S5QH56_9CAUD|nr:MAG TPA: hypothetical protein [Myoviridae sp. ctdNl2]
MDFYVNEFMENNGIIIDKPFKVENVNRPLVINTDGTMLYQDTEEVVPIGVVFSILSGAYKVVKGTDDDRLYRKGDSYYYIGSSGTVSYVLWNNDVVDYALLYMGNVFKTREEAESQVESMLSMFDSINTKTAILPNSMGNVKEDTIKDSKDEDDSKQSATLSFEKDKGGTYSGYVSYINNKGNLVTKELDSYKSLSDILKMALKDVYSE